METSEQMKILRGRGMKLGTRTTRILLDRLGSPDETLKIVHVAGTNGKGSAAEFMTGILTAAGKRTGTFTSPEIYAYNDMFRVDGLPLSDGVLADCLAEACAAAEGLDATSFEAEMAAALVAFRRAGCEYAVLECGMGGRDDATNAVRRKEIAIITSVSLEHTAYLGGTVREICEKKAGIVRDCPAVIHPVQTEEGREYLLHIAGAIAADMPQRSADGRHFAYRGKMFEIGASGAAQPANAACAIEAARRLKIDENAIYEGVKRTNPAGRLQRFYKQGRVFLLDGAHNPAAFVPLGAMLEEENLPADRTLVYGCLSDKDPQGCLRALKGKFRRAIAVRPDSPRAMELNKIAAACKTYFSAAAEADSVSGALDATDSELVVVCGSFTLLKEAKEWIEKG